MKCFEPSLILDVAEASLFGAIPEAIIEADYLRFVGRVGAFPLSTTEFFDIREPFPSPTVYRSFLKSHHPHLSLLDLLKLSRSQTRIPDIMTHDSAGGVFEFYEIKPGSKAGKRDGEEKVVHIHALVQFFGLPYVPGTIYAPNMKIEFFSGRSLGIDIRLFLEVQPGAVQGLLLYKVCVDGPDWLPEEVLVAAAAAVLIAMIALSRGKIHGSPPLSEEGPPWPSNTASGVRGSTRPADVRLVQRLLNADLAGGGSRSWWWTGWSAPRPRARSPTTRSITSCPSSTGGWTGTARPSGTCSSGRTPLLPGFRPLTRIPGVYLGAVERAEFDYCAFAKCVKGLGGY